MYITTRIREKPPKQLSFEDMFRLMLESKPDPVQPDGRRAAYTRTYYVRDLPARIRAGCDVPHMIAVLREFNQKHEELHRSDIASHYRKFFIPKKTGGLREINAPDDDLALCLRELKLILEKDFYAMHHASAYAYVSGRSTKDAVAVHQRNDSRWFLKLDLHGFFPSTTLDFTMEMLSKIYPFALVMQEPEGERELRKALSLAFLNGGLPMGTPLSPCLTNLIMIPFDYEFSRYLRRRYDPHANADNKGRMFAYTRYADDMDISCRIWFNKDVVIDKIKEIFRHFHAPYQINAEKTHYGSRNGKNWMLGLMLNSNNEITIGHKKKENLRAMLTNYVLARTSGTPWTLEQLQYLRGIISYYRMVNQESTNAVIAQVGVKRGVDVEDLLKQDIRAA